MDGPWGRSLSFTKGIDDGKIPSHLTSRSTSFDSVRSSILLSTTWAVSLDILPMVGLTVCWKTTTEICSNYLGVLRIRELRANVGKIFELMSFS